MSKLFNMIAVFVVLYLATTSYSETIVGGIISTDTSWDVADSPFIVSENIAVLGGARLDISEGVVVRFAPAKALIVNDGTLAARGTSESNIIFTANNSQPDNITNRWGYLGFGDAATDAVFDSSGNCTNGCYLEHAVIEYAGVAGVHGAVYALKSAPYIHNCIIRYNYDGGVSMTSNTGARVIGNDIVENHSAHHACGIAFEFCEGVRIEDNSVVSNTMPSFMDGLGCVYVTDSVDVRVSGCKIEGNFARYGGGLGLVRVQDACVSNNVFTRNEANMYGGGFQISLSPGATVCNNQVTYNTAKHSGGIHISSSPYTRIEGNFIQFNSAEYDVGGLRCSYSDGAVVADNVISGNTAGDDVGGIWIEQTPDASIDSNTIISNSSSLLGSGLLLSFSDNAHLHGNTVGFNRGRLGGTSVRMSDGVTICADLIVSNNSDHGLYLDEAGSIVVSSSPLSPTRIFGNTGAQLYNNNAYAGSPEPLGDGNVDARHVWWGTTNEADVGGLVYDYFDSAGKGLVFFDPLFGGWATNEVPINWLQGHGLSTNTSDVVGDQDGDGSATWQEFFAGTNPTNEHSVFLISTIVSQSSSNIVLNWLSVSNKTYSIECTSNLNDGTWASIMSNIQGLPPMNTETVQVESADCRFYRITIE